MKFLDRNLMVYMYVYFRVVPLVKANEVSQEPLKYLNRLVHCILTKFVQSCQFEFDATHSRYSVCCILLTCVSDLVIFCSLLRDMQQWKTERRRRFTVDQNLQMSATHQNDGIWHYNLFVKFWNAQIAYYTNNRLYFFNE